MANLERNGGLRRRSAARFIFRRIFCTGCVCIGIWVALAGVDALAAPAEPQTVHFPSADGRTELTGYLFMPQDTTLHAAVVMLHGRAGPYSSNVNAGCTFVGVGIESPCNAGTLTMRHKTWGAYWAERGYIALHVDSFGPRGKAHGFPRNSHEDPARDDVNERTVRPLDAEGALAWLAARDDVARDRIFLQGWSNGGSTVLNVMSRQADPSRKPGAPAFRAALSFYPGCGPKALLASPYVEHGPLLAFLGEKDEEVSPVVCRRVLGNARDAGAEIQVIWYPGATHDFDDPGRARQAVEGNRAARDDATQRAAQFFESMLQRNASDR